LFKLNICYINTSFKVKRQQTTTLLTTPRPPIASYFIETPTPIEKKITEERPPTPINITCCQTPPTGNFFLEQP